MRNFFSRERLKNLAISILLLIATNIFVSWIQYRSYAYNDLTASLAEVMVYMHEIQQDIFQKQIDYEEPRDASSGTSPELINEHYWKEIFLYKTLNVKTEDFDWENVRLIVANINRILASETVSRKDMDYLDLAYSYIGELQDGYKAPHNEQSIFSQEGSFFTRDKNLYVNFLKNAEKISELAKYKALIDNESEDRYNFPDYMDETKYVYSAEDEKKAEEFSREIFRKITGRTDEVVNLGFEYGRYVFENRPEENEEDEIYQMEVISETGDFFIYKSMRYSRGAITEEMMDEAAADMIERITDENYVCYEKIPVYDDRKLQEIEYSFIRKTDGIYNENRMISIRLDHYGHIAHVEVSNVLNEETDIHMTQDADISELQKYDPEQIVLVQNKNDEAEYHIYTDFNGDMYTTVIDADTMEIKSAGKSERIYYKEITLR